MHIDDLLRLAVDSRASDVHLRVGLPPVFRVDGSLIFQYEIPEMTADGTRQILEQITTQEERNAFDVEMELDFAYSVEGVSRFRVNAYYQMGTVALVFRIITSEIPTIDDLGMPDICKDLVLESDGLVIVTGPTGCGKSTTLAAMLGYLNARQTRKVITIEDPIEYIHHDNQCIFSQRENGTDTVSFASALKHALRQDPDVIMVGEMRDLETISTALTAAETGHLVMTTLHTPGVAQAMDRMIDVFPPHQQQQIRMQLASTVKGALYQALIPSVDERGRVAAVEVLVATTAIKAQIREGKTHQILGTIETSTEYGMQTLDQALIQLYKAKKISRDRVFEWSRDPEGTKRILDGMLLKG
ncbi:MAG: type IV pilus twitching motility protein PilT [Dehalococcoidia bacterium]